MKKRRHHNKIDFVVRLRGACVTEKVSYISASAAKVAAKRFESCHRNLHVKLRSYRCTICDNYHITSQPRRR